MIFGIKKFALFRILFLKTLQRIVFLNEILIAICHNERRKFTWNVKKTDLKVALADFKEEKEIEATSIEELYLNDRELFESFRKLIRFSSYIGFDIDVLITVYGYFSVDDNIPQEPLLKMFKLLFQIRESAELLSLELQETQGRLKENSGILSSLRSAFEEKEC